MSVVATVSPGVGGAVIHKWSREISWAEPVWLLGRQPPVAGGGGTAGAQSSVGGGTVLPGPHLEMLVRTLQLKQHSFPSAHSSFLGF